MKLSELTRLLQRAIAEEDFEISRTYFAIELKGGGVVTTVNNKLVLYPTRSSRNRREYE